MALDIVGPFSAGAKCQLNAIKTCSVGAAVATLLFFTCSAGKFCVIQQDDLVANKLQLTKTYFVKNVKKQFDDVYLAYESTVLTESKKPIKISESFQENEIEELLTKVRDANLDIAPPPFKRVKLEEPSTSTSTKPSTISLSAFLTTPHSETKDSLVQMTVCGNHVPQYDREPGVGYLKLIVADTKEKNIMKEIIIYFKTRTDCDNVLNDAKFSRGSVLNVKGEYLRFKTFGTAKSDNFSEKLKRPSVDGSNTFGKAMEDAIANYRGAAEKTFNFTKPGDLFRDLNASTEINNLRLTAPLEIAMANLKQQFKLVKKISWSEMSNFLENLSEVERDIKMKPKLSTDCVLLTVFEIKSQIESTGVVLINSIQKKAVFSIPPMDIRRVEIPVEVNATYVGIIMQKSENDNIFDNYDGSITIKLEWIERVDQPYLEEMCDLDLDVPAQ